MRTKQEMMALLFTIAEADERIRAVYMNGSRVNPSAPKDVYQDYDVVFVVTETASFLADPNWPRRFGNPLIVQEPDRNDGLTGLGEPGDFRRYAWLMLFDDGNRVDLTIEIPEEAVANVRSDGLTLCLLDKDGLLPALPPPTDEQYHVKPPSEGAFHACCNEFWWCLNNVAKGLAREELPYALRMLNIYVRDMLDQMAEWHIGVDTEFSVSAGKMGKYFKDFLPKALYARYCETYAAGNTEDVWRAVFALCDLFKTLALPVAARFGFSYLQSEEDGIHAYLAMVRGGALSQNG